MRLDGNALPTSRIGVRRSCQVHGPDACPVLEVGASHESGGAGLPVGLDARQRRGSASLPASGPITSRFASTRPLIAGLLDGVEAMLNPRPLCGVQARTAWLRAVLLSACFLGMVLSAPLWWNDRLFPLLPIASWIPNLPAPWDKCIFGATLASLVVALWCYRPAVVFFLAATLFLYFGDQNRGQPWFYLYWVMLLLSLMPEPAGVSGCRLLLTAVYLWGGIQKLNGRFFNEVPPWFVSPAAGWGVPTSVVHLLQWAVASAPFIEIFIALAFWVPRLRKLAVGAIVVVHGAALVFLGPLGHNLNRVIWPWNLAMIALVIVLFPVNPPARLAQNVLELRKSMPALLVTLLVCALPALSFFGWWDKSFSFALYSGNQATADIFVSESFAERLPEAARAHVHRVKQEYHPALQGPFVFDYITWGMKEVGAPPILEPRNYRSVYRFLRRHAATDADVRMVVVAKAGWMSFYLGDDVQELPMPGR